MHFVVELSPKEISEIERLVNEGRYDDVRQFLRAAISNQIFLENSPLGLIGQPAQTERPLELSRENEVPKTEFNPTSRPENVPFTAETLKARKQTIWGLYNRLFPVKVATRVLANLAVQSGIEFVDFGRVQEEAATQAKLIGRRLARYDEQSGLGHGEKLSSGLPLGRSEKAAIRYMDMFVGYLKSDGRAEGLPTDLGMMIIRKPQAGSAVVALTEAGRDFAVLANPVLDGELTKGIVSALSEEESDFLLSYIRNWMPSEYSSYQVVLKAIMAGKNDPEKLDAVVKSTLSNLVRDASITHRTGIVSRLTELGLVTRKRSGLRVSYAPTMRGEKVAQERESGQEIVV